MIAHLTDILHIDVPESIGISILRNEEGWSSWDREESGVNGEEC